MLWFSMVSRKGSPEWVPNTTQQELSIIPERVPGKGSEPNPTSAQHYPEKGSRKGFPEHMINTNYNLLITINDLISNNINYIDTV